MYDGGGARPAFEYARSLLNECTANDSHDRFPFFIFFEGTLNSNLLYGFMFSVFFLFLVFLFFLNEHQKRLETCSKGNLIFLPQALATELPCVQVLQCFPF